MITYTGAVTLIEVGRSVDVFEEATAYGFVSVIREKISFAFRRR